MSQSLMTKKPVGDRNNEVHTTEVASASISILIFALPSAWSQLSVMTCSSSGREGNAEVDISSARKKRMAFFVKAHFTLQSMRERLGLTLDSSVPLLCRF